MRARRQLLTGLGALACGGPWAEARTTHAPDTQGNGVVRMPGPPLPVERAAFFQGELARLALDKAGHAADPLQLLSTQTWPRQVRELRDGHADVAPLPALDPALYAEFALLRVDFPLRRGLLGVRQLVVRADRLPEFTSLANLAELQQRHRLGYGQDWGDLPLMTQLGFQVVTARSTDLLYAALRQGGIDFLSRGLNETPSELQRFSDAQVPLAAVPGVLLFYPLDDCFFVGPHRPDLRALLLDGLNRARRDGSYRRLFQRHFGASLAAVRGSRVWPLPGYPQPPGLSLRDYDVLTRWGA